MATGRVAEQSSAKSVHELTAQFAVSELENTSVFVNMTVAAADES
jgi:hypothetical protein